MSHPDLNEVFSSYRAASDSDKPALELTLIKSLERYAKTIVFRKLREDRPDIVNEAVQFVLSHMEDFRGGSKFSTWVFTIVARFCFREIKIKIARRNTEKLFSDFEDHQLEELASYELDGDAKTTLDRLRKNVSEDENQLLDLKMQGYTNAEIAEQQLTTTTAIDGRWRRLREKLRQQERRLAKRLSLKRFFRPKAKTILIEERKAA